MVEGKDTPQEEADGRQVPSIASAAIERDFAELLERHCGALESEAGKPDRQVVVARVERGDDAYLLVRSSSRSRKLLTPQQYRIVQLIAEGLTNRQIGDVLSIRTSTVASHLARIFRKLDIDSRAALASQSLSILL